MSEKQWEASVYAASRLLCLQNACSLFRGTWFYYFTIKEQWKRIKKVNEFYEPRLIVGIYADQRRNFVKTMNIFIDSMIVLLKENC